jgi:putative oxidoreductase
MFIVATPLWLRGTETGGRVMTNGLNSDAVFKEYGIGLLRISLGVMYLAHSVVLKYFTFSLAGSAQYFVSIGLPAWLSYTTFFAEVVGGLLLVLGVQARWVALGLSPILLGAVFSAHLANGWVFTAPGGGWEYPAYLFVRSGCVTSRRSRSPPTRQNSRSGLSRIWPNGRKWSGTQISHELKPAHAANWRVALESRTLAGSSRRK